MKSVLGTRGLPVVRNKETTILPENSKGLKSLVFDIDNLHLTLNSENTECKAT